MAKMKTCKTCGKEVASSAKVCPNCGAKLKMGMFKKLLIGIGALIVIAAVSSMAGGGDKSSSTTASNNSKPATTEQAKPAELSNEGVSSDVKIAVKGFESKDTVGDNQFSTAKAQGVFKIVTVTVTNNQKDAITIDSNSFKLVDDQNREFSTSSEAQMALETSVNNKKEGFFLKQLNPGMSIDGHIVFDVPKDAKGFVLKARGGVTGKEITLKVE